MAKFCYLNGKIMSVAQAKVSILDIGMLRGYGIYEALTTHNKKPFMLADHLKRFRDSAAMVDIKVPATDQEITEAIHELIERNGYNETNIKFILTGGTAVGGIEYDPDFPTFYILAEEFSPIPDHYIQNGASLISYEFERQYPEYKTTNYITAVKLQKLRKEKGALEIMYTSKGKILELATSNFFIVKDGKIITPNNGILKGITRKVVIDLAQKNGLEVVERELTYEELKTADEAFLSASFKEVVPVTKVDDIVIGDGKVGEITKKVLKLFKNFTAAY